MQGEFSPAFLQAVAGTLLPGDDVLPTGSAAGVTLAAVGGPGANVLRAIVAKSGGAEVFAAATPARRAAILAAVEAQDATGFRALLMPLLQDYCESDAVMTALGWRPGPAQPQGYAVAPTDEETWRRLDAVRGRGRIWRDAP